MRWGIFRSLSMESKSWDSISFSRVAAFLYSSIMTNFRCSTKPYKFMNTLLFMKLFVKRQGYFSLQIYVWYCIEIKTHDEIKIKGGEL